MRLFFTLLVIIVVIGFIYMYRSDMNVDGNLAQGVSQIRQQFSNGKDNVTTTKVYKFRNAKGEWVYTNTPPDTSSSSIQKESVIELRSDTNVLPAPTKNKTGTIQKEKKNGK